MTWAAIIPSNPNPGAYSEPVLDNAARAIAAGGVGGGPWTGAVVVEMAPRAALAGGALPSYGVDLYNRIHVFPADLPLGNVTGEQQYTIRVWNAWMRAQTLTAQTAAGDEGLVLAGQGEPPIQFSALQERLYTLTIGNDGPPTIEAEYTWTFGDGEVRRLEISGARIVSWCWPPDWSERIVERLTWMTEIHASDALIEQAVRRRIWPRQELEFSAWAEGADRRTMEAAMWGWGARAWALPIYTDGQQLISEYPAGATELMIATADLQFTAGGLAQIQEGSDSRTTETIEIDAVLADRVRLVRPLRKAWKAGAWIYPMRRAKLTRETSVTPFTGDFSGARLRFISVETAPYSDAHGLPLYRGLPVLEWMPDHGETPQAGMRRNIISVDNLTGAPVEYDAAGMPEATKRLAWMWPTRALGARFRKLLYYLKGQANPIWVPTGTQDMVMVATAADSGESIDIEAIGYTAHLVGQVGRRDIRIQLHDGTIFYRRITGAQVVDGTIDRIAMDAPLGRTVTPEQVALISFIAPMVLNADAAEIAYWTGDVTTSSTTFRGWRNDL